MTYLVALALCFILWSAYAIPGNMAEKVHGVHVNMLFETLAFIAVTLFMGEKVLAGLPKVTLTSAVQASLMGLGSACGFFFFLMALSLAPGTKGLALVILVAGISFPMQSVLFTMFGESLAPQQWAAILGMAGCIALFNWKF